MTGPRLSRRRAKVRKKRYLYNHAWLAGSNFFAETVKPSSANRPFRLHAAIAGLRRFKES